MDEIPSNQWSLDDALVSESHFNTIGIVPKLMPQAVKDPVDFIIRFRACLQLYVREHVRAFVRGSLSNLERSYVISHKCYNLLQAVRSQYSFQTQMRQKWTEVLLGLRQLENAKNLYEVLGVPPSASPLAIRVSPKCRSDWRVRNLARIDIMRRGAVKACLLMSALSSRSGLQSNLIAGTELRVANFCKSYVIHSDPTCRYFQEGPEITLKARYIRTKLILKSPWLNGIGEIGFKNSNFLEDG